jgi:hypothetical protein
MARVSETALECSAINNALCSRSSLPPHEPTATRGSMDSLAVTIKNPYDHHHDRRTAGLASKNRATRLLLPL